VRVTACVLRTVPCVLLALTALVGATLTACGGAPGPADTLVVEYNSPESQPHFPKTMPQVILAAAESKACVRWYDPQPVNSPVELHVLVPRSKEHKIFGAIDAMPAISLVEIHPSADYGTPLLALPRPWGGGQLVKSTCGSGAGA
jgi:hypothetical protein